jgi:hypothetical protein
MHAFAIKRTILQHLRVTAFVFFLFGPGTAAANPTEEQVRTQLQNSASHQFESEDVALLEANCTRFLNPSERTPSGVWKLTFYQYGIDAAMARMLRATPRGGEQALINGRLQRWQALRPDSACLSITRARAYIAVAWIHRGGGYAHTVPENAWPVFRSWIEKARIELLRTKATSSENPDWYATMINVAMAQQWPDSEFESVLDEGIERHRLYYQMYFNAMQALLPKWRGDGAALERFARRALRETDQAEGLSIYARVYWSVADDYRERLFIDSSASWPLMRRSFQEILKLYPDNRNLNAFANFACIAGDAETTRRLMERIGTQIVPIVWVTSMGAEGCRDWAIRSTTRA